MMRRLRRDDEAVSEVIGFVLSFALSAVFLMISLNTFFLARQNSDDVVTGAELRSIADRVAARIVEAGLMAQEFPDAKLSVKLDVPQSLNEHPYYVHARAHAIYVNTTDLPLSATATTFNLDVVEGFEVGGEVHSSDESITITYERLASGTKQIKIQGEGE